MRRDRFRVSRFVIRFLPKTNGKRLYGPLALPLHQRGHGGGIVSPGEKRAEWNIGRHAPPDGIEQQRLQLVRQCLRRVFAGRARRHRMDIPVADRISDHLATLANRHDMRRRQFADAPINAPGRRYVVVAQKKR